MSPLMNLLRIVDCDVKPSMGYVYEGMYREVLEETLLILHVKYFNLPIELDVEELETLLYEEGSIPINEEEGSSSHVDNEDGGDVAIEGLDVENFGFPDAYFQSLYSNFQNE
ncbi:hypothetical protein CK203_077678 [Vitis vinifera]|uniref:Uncharacterized protein n=1 Tax=Vitis vinifera TaxID=29760 RepID=A0A438BXD9_VITVI|nr:hypothetical protein CK203_077678 [Vitis vinifera]